MGLVGRSLSIFGLVRTSNMPTAAEVGLTRIQSARPQPPTRDESDLAARLRSAAASPNWRPAMPPRAALEMLAVYRNPDVTFVELTEILERDAALAARVLRVASSPLYSPRQPPNSLHTAAVRLGLKTLTSIVWECAMNARIFHAEPYESAMERLSQHSTAVARIARTIARAVDEDGETAYLAGLLHDIGIGAGLALAAQARPDERASLEVVEGALALCHEEIGDLLAGAWQLPTSLSAALAYHHEPPPAGPASVAHHRARGSARVRGGLRGERHGRDLARSAISGVDRGRRRRAGPEPFDAGAARWLRGRARLRLRRRASRDHARDDLRRGPQLSLTARISSTSAAFASP